ncbi:MAG: hypothetical protein ACLTLQ_08715 [[Clostridium] scindens]
MSEVKKATRDGFGEEIVKLGKLDNDILVVDVDIGKVLHRQENSTKANTELISLALELRSRTQPAWQQACNMRGKSLFIIMLLYGIQLPARNWTILRRSAIPN